MALPPDPPFRTYSVEDGLSQKLALTVAQDGNGYIWVGSFGGLSRFDGANFDSLTTRDGLRENFIQELFVDSGDRLWAGDSSGGLTLLEQGEVVMTIAPPETIRGTARDMHEHNGWLYMGIEPQGFMRLSLEHPERGLELISTEGEELQYIASVSDDEILVLGTGGLYRYNPLENSPLRRLELDVTAISGTPESGVFVGSENGRVGRWRDGTIVWDELSYGESIWRIFMADGRPAWIATRSHIMPYGQPQEGIAIDAIDLVVDRENVTWVASSAGLSRYLGSRFDHYSLTQSGRVPDVSSIVPDDRGGYWIGSDAGLIHVDAQGVIHDANQFVSEPAIEIRGLAFDQAGRNLWIAQVDGFVVRLNLDTLQSNNVFPARESAMMGIEMDHRGRVWSGSYGGVLYAHDPETNVTREFDMGTGLAIYSPTMGPDNYLWFPVNHTGIFRIDTSRDDAEPELIIPLEDIGRNLFAHVLASTDANGTLSVWIATVEGGVFRWRNDRLERLLAGSELSDQTVYSLYPLPDNQLVLTTNRGAYHYDETADQLTNFGPLDGFVGIEGNAHSIFRADDRSLWLGTGSGVTRMKIDVPITAPTPPSAGITRVLIDDQNIGSQRTDGALVSGEKLLINYVAISTRNPDDVEYSYRISNRDQDWSAPTRNRSLGFSQLSPGNYTFQIRARHKGLTWGPIDQWSFVVPAPFWQKGWFIGLCILLGLAVTRVVVQLRLRAIARANQRLRWEVEERTRSIEQGRLELEQINAQLSTEILEREKSDALRADVEARFHQAYQNSPIGMALVDLDGLVYDANPVIKQLFWPDSKQSDREPLLNVVIDDDRKRFSEFLFRFAVGEVVNARMEVSCTASSGESRRIDFSPSAVRNAQGELQYIVLLANDVTESRAMTQKLEYHASFDELTGLINRRAYAQRLEAATRAVGLSGDAYLMFLDLDQFKVVNDTCGHGAGDELLRKVAAIIKSCVRDDDTVARLGGDEFALILSGCSEEIALERADRVRQSIQDFEFFWNSDVFRIGVSIGVVRIDGSTQDIEELQQIADAACYAAKDAGRNRVHMVENDEDTVHAQRGEMRWVQRLNHAIDTDGFVLFGQRLMSTQPSSDPHERIEVLLRMKDRAAGRLIPPAAFLPAAERYGLQTRLDLWVVNRVIDVLTHQDQTELVDRRFWVNLSGASMSDPEFSRALIERIAQSNLPPQSLNFEITETAVIRKMDDAASLVSALRGMGCKIALDDFGSGLSSFGVLKRLELDFVKIDGEFIRDIIADPTDRIFVKSIIDIAHTLNMRVVAEFVENATILDMVRELGADYAQGFGVHRPEPLENLAPPRAVRLQSGA